MVQKLIFKTLDISNKFSSNIHRLSSDSFAKAFAKGAAQGVVTLGVAAVSLIFSRKPSVGAVANSALKGNQSLSTIIRHFRYQ